MTFITVIYPFENSSTRLYCLHYSTTIYTLCIVVVYGDSRSPNFSNRIKWVDERKSVADALLAGGLNILQNLHYFILMLRYWCTSVHTQQRLVPFHDQRSFNRLNAVCRHKHDIMRT